MERFEVLIALMVSWFLAQCVKAISVIGDAEGFSFKRFIRQGGMPSSHSAVVSSLGLSCGLVRGFDSVEFAITFVLAFVVVLDAGGVRYTTGRQSRILNRAISETVSDEEKLNEDLGHTLLQILIGVILGLVVSSVTHLICR